MMLFMGGMGMILMGVDYGLVKTSFLFHLFIMKVLTYDEDA